MSETLVPAISVHQPWATLIALGEKKYETRHWIPKGLTRGDRLLIHAAKTVDKAACASEPIKTILAKIPCFEIGQLPTGCIIAETKLVGVFESELLDRLTPQERALGNFAPRRYGWQLELVRTFDTAIKYRGEQGIFWVNEDLINAPVQTMTPHICQPFTDVARIETVLDRYDSMNRCFTDSRLVYCGDVHPKFGMFNTEWKNRYVGQAPDPLGEYLSNFPAWLRKKLPELTGKTIVCACSKPWQCHCHCLADQVNYPRCAGCLANEKLSGTTSVAACACCPHVVNIYKADRAKSYILCDCCKKLEGSDEFQSAVERNTIRRIKASARLRGHWNVNVVVSKGEYRISVGDELVSNYRQGESLREACVALGSNQIDLAYDKAYWSPR